MTVTCPQCGAVWPDGQSCASNYETMLLFEFTDPGYGVVHMLTVACYLIQHNMYSDAALRWIEERLRDHLERGVPVEQIRWQTNQEADQANRKWKVTRQPEERPLPKVAWTMTLADIVVQENRIIIPNAEEYQKRVTDWAKITLKEMVKLF